jgi:hypothetical protein
MKIFYAGKGHIHLCTPTYLEELTIAVYVTH